MADVWVVLVVLAFFGLCVAMVWGCDRIIGADETERADVEAAEAVDALNAESIVGLVLAVLLAVYLFAALLFPERF